MMEQSESPKTLFISHPDASNGITPFALARLARAVGHESTIEALALGSALVDGRPVRLWLILLCEDNEPPSVISIPHVHCDVPRQEELGAVMEAAKEAIDRRRLIQQDLWGLDS